MTLFPTQLGSASHAGRKGWTYHREKEKDAVDTPEPARPAEQGPMSQALRTLRLKRLQERGKLSSFS